MTPPKRGKEFMQAIPEAPGGKLGNWFRSRLQALRDHAQQAAPAQAAEIEQAIARSADVDPWATYDGKRYEGLRVTA